MQSQIVESQIVESQIVESQIPGDQVDEDDQLSNEPKVVAPLRLDRINTPWPGQFNSSKGNLDALTQRDPVKDKHDRLPRPEPGIEETPADRKLDAEMYGDPIKPDTPPTVDVNIDTAKLFNSYVDRLKEGMDLLASEAPEMGKEIDHFIKGSDGDLTFASEVPTLTDFQLYADGAATTYCNGVIIGTITSKSDANTSFDLFFDPIVHLFKVIQEPLHSSAGTKRIVATAPGVTKALQKGIPRLISVPHLGPFKRPADEAAEKTDDETSAKKLKEESSPKE